MSDDGGMRAGIGCILFVLALFLLIVLFGTVDHIIAYINARLS